MARNRSSYGNAVGRALRLAAAAGLALSTAATAGAQVPGNAAADSRRDIERFQRFDELQKFETDNRLRANTEIPVGQRLLVDYGGYATFNYLSLDDHQSDNHILRQYDVAGYVRLNLDAANEVFVRARASVQDYAPGDSFESRDRLWLNPDIERGYYRFDLARYQAAYRGQKLDYNFVFEAGRDLVYWGNGLTIGEVIDGGIIDLSYKSLTLELIAGVTPTRTVDIDTSRPAFYYNTRRGFYGAQLSAQAGSQRPFIYGLIERDYNGKNESHQGSIDTRYSYNAYYLGAGMSGQITDKLAYSVEAVYEGGNTLSNSFKVSGFSLLSIPQTRDTIQAGAADFRLEYVPGDRHLSRFAIETVIATGDPDRGNSTNTFNGNQPGTLDRSFNSFGLVNAGLAFAPQVSNLWFWRAGASTYPLVGSTLFRRFQVGADVFIYQKLMRHGAISEATTEHYFLGWEPDIYVNWQITSDVTLAIRYGIFFPDKTTIVSHVDNRQFLYTGVTFAF